MLFLAVVLIVLFACTAFGLFLEVCSMIKELWSWKEEE